MESKQNEPVLPSIVQNWRNRKLRKKQAELDELKLDIEKAKLIKELKKIRDEVNS